jgi:hypothetical protein
MAVKKLQENIAISMNDESVYAIPNEATGAGNLFNPMCFLISQADISNKRHAPSLPRDSSAILQPCDVESDIFPICNPKSYFSLTRVIILF